MFMMVCHGLSISVNRHVSISPRSRSSASTRRNTGAALASGRVALLCRARAPEAGQRQGRAEVGGGEREVGEEAREEAGKGQVILLVIAHGYIYDKIPPAQKQRGPSYGEAQGD